MRREWEERARWNAGGRAPVRRGARGVENHVKRVKETAAVYFSTSLRERPPPTPRALSLQRIVNACLRKNDCQQ